MIFTTSIPKNFLMEYADKADSFMENLEDLYSPQGWFRFFDPPLKEILPSDVLSLSQEVDYIVSIGVGGSYMGLQSLVDFLGQSDKWLFLGPSLDPLDVKERLLKLEGKNWGLLVISKSGSTFEIQIMTELLKAKISKSQWVIGVSSSPEFSKSLAEFLQVPVYFVKIDPNTGGRYSLFDPLGILVLFLLGEDWQKVYLEMQEEKRSWRENPVEHASFSRGVGRFLLQKRYGVKVEMLSTKDRGLKSLLCWSEQLFAESGGKFGNGIYPSRLYYPRDAHSIGQILSQGPRNVVETFYLLEYEENTPVPTFLSPEDFMLLKKSGDIFIQAIKEDRLQKDVTVQCYSIKPNVTDLFRVFWSEMLAVSLENYLVGVNPYDQPGVESYKDKIRRGRPGQIL